MKISLTPYLIFALVLLFSFVCLVESNASTAQRYMFIRQGAAGLDFYCADTPVYEDVQPMSLEDYSPFALNPQDLELYAHVIEVASCNLDNLYANDGGYMFAWRFDERVTDNHSDHRHMSRGAAWVRLLSFE